MAVIPLREKNNVRLTQGVTEETLDADSLTKFDLDSWFTEEMIQTKIDKLPTKAK